MPFSMRVHGMRDTAAGLAIGALGGLVFWLLGIPAPWLAGSMIAAIIAAQVARLAFCVSLAVRAR